MVIANLAERKTRKKKKRKRINEKGGNIKERYYNVVEQKIGNNAARREESDLEDLWIVFKETLLEVAEAVCGTIKNKMVKYRSAGCSKEKHREMEKHTKMPEELAENRSHPSSQIA
ncbi:hypothetical protein ILUMI_03002 [Ignelater luminosus]|uniref:Uncharacterized protein n=1 Tax=Ignelater luminosus TaxID=2038154 RepID=A0A8K0GKW0_IGNLU|nr:hypothetical protein ILUMI_03002 [Ignelater luminosus]